MIELLLLRLPRDEVDVERRKDVRRRVRDRPDGKLGVRILVRCDELVVGKILFVIVVFVCRGSRSVRCWMRINLNQN